MAPHLLGSLDSCMVFLTSASLPPALLGIPLCNGAVIGKVTADAIQAKVAPIGVEHGEVVVRVRAMVHLLRRTVLIDHLTAGEPLAEGRVSGAGVRRGF